jgi:hypothetical protein
MKWTKEPAFRITAVITVILMGILLRLVFAVEAPADWDEDDYLSPARVYRELMIAGEYEEIPNVQQNREHPPLVKLLYAGLLDEEELGEIPLETFRGQKSELPEDSLRNTRISSVVFGGLTLILLAALNPLAVVFLAIDPIHVHFTGTAYLDAMPTFFTALMAFLYLRSLPLQDIKQKRWHMVGASVSFGIAVACKYPYAMAGVALLLHALVYRHYKLPLLFGWGVLSIVVFFALNPYLWPNPPERLEYQFTYHEDYAEGQIETFTLTKPIDQITDPNYYLPQEFQFHITRLLAIGWFFAAIPGLVLLLRQKSFFGWWFAIGLAFLTAWPTQWIQHNMIIVVPYSVCIATGMVWLLRRGRAMIQQR